MGDAQQHSSTSLSRNEVEVLSAQAAIPAAALARWAAIAGAGALRSVPAQPVPAA